jgi:hypothetical protein
MIHAASWFCAGHCGVVVPHGEGSRQQRSPALAMGEEMISLIGRPVKHFSRMTVETQFCLCAAGLALKTTKWGEKGATEIGLLAAGFDGCLRADQDYFRDYVSSGRTLGRANLFIYTLPTSAACAVAIALGLTGPALYFHDDALALPALVRHAQQMAVDREADGMLALWSDPQAAVCLAIDADEEIGYLPWLQSEPDPSPTQLARKIQSMIAQS